MVNTQFAAIGILPVGIQIHNHRICPTFIIPKLVKMLFVETSFFVQSVMKFIAGYPCKTSAVQVTDKAVHQVEKTIFMQIVMLPVKPVDLVAPDQFVVGEECIIANTRCKQLLVGIQGD